MTPGQYLNHCRLKAAEEMLVGRPNLNVTQVALACGLGSGQHFPCLFKGD